MERIWEGLKKIEAQAENVRAEAQNNADKITRLAQQRLKNSSQTEFQ